MKRKAFGILGVDNDGVTIDGAGVLGAWKERTEADGSAVVMARTVCGVYEYLMGANYDDKASDQQWELVNAAVDVVSANYYYFGF